MTVFANIAAARTIHFPPSASHGVDLQDDRFLQLMKSLRPYGGMLPDEDVRSIGFVSRAPFSLGEALMQRVLFALTWRHRLWLPMFQFRMPDLAVSPQVSSIANLMHPVVQGFELAEWFVAPNPWLDEQTPLDAIESDSVQVMNAARADRFVRAG